MYVTMMSRYCDPYNHHVSTGVPEYTRVPRIYDFSTFFDVEVLFWKLKVRTPIPLSFMNSNLGGGLQMIIFCPFTQSTLKVCWRLWWSFLSVTLMPTELRYRVCWAHYKLLTFQIVMCRTFLKIEIRVCCQLHISHPDHDNSQDDEIRLSRIANFQSLLNPSSGKWVLQWFSLAFSRCLCQIMFVVTALYWTYSEC